MFKVMLECDTAAANGYAPLAVTFLLRLTRQIATHAY
jgi:hypothetical protein